MSLLDYVTTKSAADILQSRGTESKAESVFGNFIHKGELSILFGDSNTGKTILANDIAFFVGGGGHDWPDMVSPKLNTMYIDMEMTESQYANRYAGATSYIPDNYTRAEVNVLGPSEGKILSAIKAHIIMQQQVPEKAPKFIVIDNITNGFGSIYSAAQMRKMVSELKILKSRFDLTILLIAHCPKRRPWSPITQDSLGGSKMLINFVDSAFAIAPSIHGEDIKYIKQIKTREDKKMKDVLTVQITDEPYLSFKVLGTAEESQHLTPDEDMAFYRTITPDVEIQLVSMLAEGKMTFSAIANALNVPKVDVVNYAMENNFVN